MQELLPEANGHKTKGMRFAPDSLIIILNGNKCLHVRKEEATLTIDLLPKGEIKGKTSKVFYYFYNMEIEKIEINDAKTVITVHYYTGSVHGKFELSLLEDASPDSIDAQSKLAGITVIGIDD